MDHILEIPLEKLPDIAFEGINRRLEYLWGIVYLPQTERRSKHMDRADAVIQPRVYEWNITLNLEALVQTDPAFVLSLKTVNLGKVAVYAVLLYSAYIIACTSVG